MIVYQLKQIVLSFAGLMATGAILLSARLLRLSDEERDEVLLRSVHANKTDS